MSRVYYEPDNDMWIHADTGNKIRAWDVRNTEPHRSEIAKRGGASHLYGSSRVAGDVTEPGTVSDQEARLHEVPIPPSTPAAEEEYVEELLRDGNYA